MLHSITVRWSFSATRPPKDVEFSLYTVTTRARTPRPAPRIGDRISSAILRTDRRRTRKQRFDATSSFSESVTEKSSISPTDFPGVAFARRSAAFLPVSSPDPNLILGIPKLLLSSPEPSFESALAARKRLLGGNSQYFLPSAIEIVRGWRQFLFDQSGRAYLDVYNNVPLVGHSHPRVVGAAQNQLALLNTNTRYLHDNILRYAQRLTALLPSPLRVCYFLNSGSEANELALRLARTHTRREDIIVLKHAYHGHTTTLIDISPYKFKGPGGQGQKPWVHVAPIPDDYRGRHLRGESEFKQEIWLLRGRPARKSKKRRAPSRSLHRRNPSEPRRADCFSAHYLSEVYTHVRAAGGVCIADEVQVGFGRLGTHFWGFETQHVIPDVVVLGKPIGNAFPLAAVVTTPEIAASFDNGMEFFSTFGESPSPAPLAWLSSMFCARKTSRTMRDKSAPAGSKLCANSSPLTPSRRRARLRPFPRPRPRLPPIHAHPRATASFLRRKSSP